MELAPEENVTQVLVPPNSHLQQIMNVLRSAAMWPSTAASVELGVLDDGFNVLISSPGLQLEGEGQDGLVAALELNFTADGQLFDFGVLGHDQEGKIVCGNCSLQADPSFMGGWTQDEFGDTCPLCAGVEAVGPDSAGVGALAEVLGAGKVGEQEAPINSMKQPKRPTVAQAKRSAALVAEMRAKSPILRKR